MVTYYKSTDAGAPVITGEAGSLIAALDACLVTGYGDKAAAGWTKPFEGTNKAVFRNDTVAGSGRFFQCLNDGSVLVAGNSHVCGIRGFASMSTVDDGMEPFPTVPERGMGQLIRTGSGSGNVTGREWHIMADSRAVHIFIGGGANWTLAINRTNICSAHAFFGDLAHQPYSLDPYATMCCGAQNTITPTYAMSNFLSGAIGTTGNYMSLMRGYLGTIGAIQGRTDADAQQAVTAHLGRLTGGTRAWSNHTGVELLSRLGVYDGNTPTPRGYVPGVLAFWGEAHPTWDTPTPVTIAGESYLPIALRNSSNIDYLTLVQITGSWR